MSNEHRDEVKLRRERGAGRVFKPKNSKFLWIQYYERGAQIRVSAETDDPRKAEKILRLISARSRQVFIEI